MKKEERKRRKELLLEIRIRKRERANAELPAPLPVLLGLFQWLDAHSDTDCDGTLRFTLEYCRSKGLDEEKLAEWAAEYGGYCDCEVLANVPGTNPAFT